jgi:soluble lytic murein transglycosylase
MKRLTPVRTFAALLMAGAVMSPPEAGAFEGLLSFLTGGNAERTGSLAAGRASSDIRGLSSSEGARLKRALAAYRQGEIQTGDSASRELQDPTARALAEWAAIRAAGSNAGFERIAGFLETFPEWPTRGNLRRRAEEALVAENRSPAELKKFFTKYKPVTPGGKLAFANALRASGQEAQAVELVRNAWTNDSFGRDLEQRYLAAYGGVLRKSDHHRRVELLIFAENYDGALRAAAYVGPEEVAIARAAAAVGQKSGSAPSALAAVPARLRSQPLALYAQVQHLRRSDKAVEAAEALAGVPDAVEAHHGDDWWMERRLVARRLVDAGSLQLAYKVAAGHNAESAATKVEAEFHAGWIALRGLKDPALAQKHFNRAAQVATTPISISRAAYWQGRAAEAGNGNASAFYQRAAAYPTTYYGQLARAKINHRDMTIPMQQGSASAAALPALRAVTMLYEADERELAMPLIGDLAQTLTDVGSLDALADIAAERGDARAVLVVGKAATQRGFALNQHAFPVFGIPQGALRESPVEKPLVFAITRQESAFDPRAVSSAGARGLMQLMPATARIEASKVGIGYDASRLNDPSYNVTLGSAHLGRLVDNYNGSYILAIAAYNAGPGNVKKWVEAYGDPRDPNVDPVDWVERIPFSETRNYVQRVMENLQVYRSRLGEKTTLLLDSDLKRGGR